MENNDFQIQLQEQMKQQAEQFQNMMESMQQIQKKMLEQSEQLFAKRTVELATAEEKKELYASEEVRTETGTKKLDEVEQLEQDMKKIIAWANSVPKHICTGKIIRIQTWGTKVIARVQPDGITPQIAVYIPANQLFKYDEKDYAGEKGKEYLVNEIKDRRNAKIHFVIQNVIESEKSATASRLSAMQMESHAFYVKEMNDGKPRYVEGMKVRARVVGVRKDRVRVEVGGAETTMSNRDLSWTSLGVLKDEFKVNQEFDVLLKKIKTNVKFTTDGQKYTLVEVEASKKEASKSPAELYYDTFNIGDITTGIIKSFSQDQKFVYVNIEDKMDCMARFPSSGIPEIGQSCCVQIIDKNDEAKQIAGRIIDLD